VGRRHLIHGAALAAALVVTAAAPAAASLRRQLVAHGAAGGGVGQDAYVALDRSAARSFRARLDPSGAAALARVDFRRSAAVAVFGPYGCQDARVSVRSIVQRGKTLAVTLFERALPPGTAECMAVFETYRLLTIARAALHSPDPTRATVTLARA
jgi:hypothetical protein